MNTKLESLIEKSWLSEKDAYEIRQIFCFLSDEKKQNILDNFDFIVFNIKKIRQDLIKEQEILLWRAVMNIENAIKNAKIAWYKKATSWVINEFKKQIL